MGRKKKIESEDMEIEGFVEDIFSDELDEMEVLPEMVELEQLEKVEPEVEKRYGKIHSVRNSFVVLEYNGTLTWIPKSKNYEYTVGEMVEF